MTSPRHLWSGPWREEAERAESQRRASQPRPVPEDQPPAGGPSPEPPGPPPARRRRARVVAVAIAVLGLVGAGAGAMALLDGDDDVAPLSVNTAALPKGPAHTPTGAIYRRASPAVVSVRAGSGSGTGFLVTDTRTIVTNAHVVSGQRRAQVRFGADGDDIPAEIVGSDPSSDLAVVRIAAGAAPADAKPLELADSGQVQVGDRVVAIGNPFGLDRTATEGIVSALGRSIQAPNGFSIRDAIQTDAPINPGNSGGPLLDAAGRVIGVNSQIETGGGSRGNVGIGFAVPANAVRQIVPRLMRGQTIERGWLGIEMAAQPGGGALVSRLVTGGPAQESGLRAGDVIVSLDGQSVAAIDDVSAAVDARGPGEKLRVEVRRGLRTETIEVTLGKRPAQVP